MPPRKRSGSSARLRLVQGGERGRGTAGTRGQLLQARRQGTLVRYGSRLEPGHVDARILDVGPRFFLAAVVDSGMRWDGFSCGRIADVRELRPSPSADFVMAALRRRGLRAPRRPRVSVADLERLLRTAARAAPLVAVHRQAADPEVCHIGRVVEVRRGRLALLEIDANAVWDERPTDYPLFEITRVDFGGAYEEALHLVGGEPS